jgi:hypothetical protein
MPIYQETNAFLEECFHALEAPFPSPEPTKQGADWVLCYHKDHHCLELAIIQKLARQISGLSAALLLLNEGFTQEVGTIFRTLDEFLEDIIFLALPSMFGRPATATHKKYLNHFFQEQFDNYDDPILSEKKWPGVVRKKIRAAISDSGQTGLNPHDAREVFRTISETYGGFVHGASSHICEMIGDESKQYYLSGMIGTSQHLEFRDDYWSYASRGLAASSIAATALRNTTVAEKVAKYTSHFEATTGNTASGDPEKLMRELKAKKPKEDHKQ